MNARVRLLLCSVCLVVGIVEARQSMHVFAQDLRGPYEGNLARAVVDSHGQLVLVERPLSADAVLEARVPSDTTSRDAGSEHGRDRGQSRASAATHRR